MNNSEQDKISSFYERYSGLSDSQIKEILRNHKDYQELAVKAAVKIAIERELIHSEQDLFAPEYQTKLPKGLSVFPVLKDVYNYKKVISSIFRVLFILSFIPIIFGVLKYAEGKMDLAYQGIGLGLVWSLLTFILFKTRRSIFIFLLMFLLVFVFLVVGYWVVNQKVVVASDVVMLIIGTALPMYFLLYLRKLFQIGTDSLSDL